MGAPPLARSCHPPPPLPAWEPRTAAGPPSLLPVHHAHPVGRLNPAALLLHATGSEDHCSERGLPFREAAHPPSRAPEVSTGTHPSFVSAATLGLLGAGQNAAPQTPVSGPAA